MKVKTKDLIGPALDWAVATAEYTDGRHIVPLFGHSVGVETAPGSSLQFKFWPSTDWAQGGPIIERERISTSAQIGRHATGEWYANYTPIRVWIGPTPLIAAMRCFVASKLGDEVDVPEELT